MAGATDKHPACGAAWHSTSSVANASTLHGTGVLASATATSLSYSAAYHSASAVTNASILHGTGFLAALQLPTHAAASTTKAARRGLGAASWLSRGIRLSSGPDGASADI